MPDNPTHKVLIAEDESLVSDVLSRKLIKEGFDVTVAVNGQMALDKLKAGKFDLLLLDLTMPDVDGFQVLTQLKEQNIAMPIIVISNLSQPEDVAKAKALGAQDYIIKASANPAFIVQRVRECILEHKC